MAGLFETISSATERLEEIRESTPQKPEDIEVRVRPNEHSYMKKQDEIIHIETSQVHKATGKRITLDMPLKEFLTDKWAGYEVNPDIPPPPSPDESSGSSTPFGFNPEVMGEYSPEGYPEAQPFLGGQTGRTPWYLGWPANSHVNGEIEIVVKGKKIGSFKYYLNESEEYSAFGPPHDISKILRPQLVSAGQHALSQDNTSFEKLRQITEPLRETALDHKNKLTNSFLNSIGRSGPLKTDSWVLGGSTKGQPWYRTYDHPPLPGVQSTDMFVEAMEEFYYPDRRPNPIQTTMQEYKVPEEKAVKLIEDQIALRAQWSLADVVTYINRELRRTEKGIHRPLTSHSPDQDTFLANCIKRPVMPLNERLYKQWRHVIKNWEPSSGSSFASPFTGSGNSSSKSKGNNRIRLAKSIGRSFFCIDVRRGRGFDKLLDIIDRFNPEAQMMIISRIADAMRTVGKAEMRNFNLGFYMFAANAFNPTWAINWSMDRYERMRERSAERRADRMAIHNLVGGILEVALSTASLGFGIPFAMARRGMQIKSNLSKLERQAREEKETQEQIREETEEFREDVEEDDDQGVTVSDPAKDPKRVMKKLTKYGAIAGVAAASIWSALELTD